MQWDPLHSRVPTACRDLRDAQEHTRSCAHQAWSARQVVSREPRLSPRLEPRTLHVEMQRRMLQQDKPEDFVIATGIQHSVRDFVTLAAEVIRYQTPLESPGRG